MFLSTLVPGTGVGIARSGPGEPPVSCEVPGTGVDSAGPVRRDAYRAHPHGSVPPGADSSVCSPFSPIN